MPSALSLLTTSFTGQKDRGRAFGIYGAIAGAGGALGLLLGGVLTEFLSWRWTLYVNLIFAGVSVLGGALLLKRQPSPTKPRLDIPGVLLVSGAVFCLVYGFANAASHSWSAPSTYGFLTAGLALGALFALWQGRAAHPLLPPRVVLDRNRGGGYLSMFAASAGLFGTFLFLTYYLQEGLRYSPLVTGVAFLPLSAGLILAANLSTIWLMPRVGPKPLVALGMLCAAPASLVMSRASWCGGGEERVTRRPPAPAHGRAPATPSGCENATPRSMRHKPTSTSASPRSSRCRCSVPPGVRRTPVRTPRR